MFSTGSCIAYCSCILLPNYLCNVNKLIDGDTVFIGLCVCARSEMVYQTIGALTAYRSNTVKLRTSNLKYVSMVSPDMIP